MKLALILAIGLYNAASVQGSRLCITLYALSLGAPSWLVGTLVALYYVLPIFAGLAIGRMIDRTGAGRMLAVCGSLTLASFLLPLALPGYASLAVSACLAGISFVAVSVAANVIVPQMGGPEDHTRNFSWYALASSAGMASGPLIAGFGIDHVGHRLTFGLLCIVPLAMLSVLYAARHLLPEAVPRKQASKGSITELVRAPGVPVPLIGGALAPIVLDLFFFVVPLHATHIGLSASTIGTILGFSSGCSMAMRVVLPRIARRVKDWTLVAASFAGTGFFLALVPLADGTPWLLVLAMGAGFSTGVSAPMVLTVLYNSLPQGRQGELLGVRAMLLSAGQMAAPSMVGVVSGVTGLAPVVALLGAAVMGYGWMARREGIRVAGVNSGGESRR